MNCLSILLPGLLSFIYCSIGTKKMLADKSKSTVTYTMVHPMHKWDGVSSDVSAALLYEELTKQVQSVAVLIRVATFNSQNQNRDSHMVEVLEGLKYPTVSFTSQDVKHNADGTLTANGKLTFHNVTRPMSIQVNHHEAASQLIVNGTFNVKLSDYAIDPPSLLGISTKDQFTITFVLAFTK
jgi:polyisoprenoid-binding protein YceI